ncbi:hypothetical protein [Paenibacillus aestuarii]|uniref:Uncharacterized protein n=1 Tax=Paenibacillus aestuarii TaxID=516965 RepID=A0ABW0KAM7_9BACL|nr:hypothetical protein [Paenibacillus aestuarii]
MKNKKMWMWKFFTYIPFLIIALIIGSIHAWLFVQEKVAPYPAPYGRATVLPQMTTDGIAAQKVGDGQFAYRTGASLTYARIDETGLAALETRPLPDQGLFNSYVLSSAGAVWVGDGGRLYASEWKGGSWQNKHTLIDPQVKGVRAAEGADGADGAVWLAYNEQAVFVLKRTVDGAAQWSKLDIPDVSEAKASLNNAGNLDVVYVATKEGRASLGYVQLDKTSWRPLQQQTQLKEVELASFNHLDDFSFVREGSTIEAAYTISSSKSGKSSLHLLTFAADAPALSTAGVADTQLQIPVTDAVNSDTNLEPVFHRMPSGEIQLVVSAVYEKNRRLTSQELYAIGIQGGKPSSTMPITHAGGFAVYPTMLAVDGHTAVVWLEAAGEGEYRVNYATDQPAYAQRMNRWTGTDYVNAIKTAPLLWGIGLLTALLSLKWIVLPTLYLLALNAFRQHHYDEHPRLHFGLSLGMYLAVKVLLLGDYRKPATLAVMPEALRSWLVYLAIVAVIAVISYALTRIWRKGLDERNVGLELLYFVLLDGFMTNLWFSYFVSLASL